ncbi:MAG: UDP-N-acetylglucosamine 1-carboxyvinyltransferase 1 [Chlamydiia bacterium]|nr:UDP-N-acetylglucosamine 1-carboxyvinyltransferase 1 [Chlamydiia bacterium]
MEFLQIKGGHPLEGSVKASGAKNAVTKMLVASLLSDKKCIFHNVPNIIEVEVTVELCQEIGMEVFWDKSLATMEVQTKELKSCYVPQRLSGRNRIPILMIGALLGRTSEDIIVPAQGGCNIGKRPVNFHIAALEKLGATVEFRKMKKEGAYIASAHNGLTGAHIRLDYPSVGATENTMLAACRAKGKTVIQNAAIEPEIIDLILFLQKLGVNIHVDSNRTIVIEETKTFYEVEHHVLTDRIEVASLAMAGIGTKGKVFVEGARQDHMIIFLNKLREIGGGFDVKKDGIDFYYKGPLKAGVHFETDVHPGFLTDWQQPFVTLLTQAEGASVIHETVYENRFGYLENLKEMGADAELFKECLGGRSCRFKAQNHYHSAVIKGPTKLTGKKIKIPDLRAGYAYVLAALIAEDTSEIHNLYYLDRGYEQIDVKLASLGADIQRKTAKIKKAQETLAELILTKNTL